MFDLVKDKTNASSIQSTTATTPRNPVFKLSRLCTKHLTMPGTVLDYVQLDFELVYRRCTTPKDGCKRMNIISDETYHRNTSKDTERC